MARLEENAVDARVTLTAGDLEEITRAASAFLLVEVQHGGSGQLAQVAGDSGTVTVQVLPFDAGAHRAAGDGALSVLQFTGTAGLGLVHPGGSTPTWFVGSEESS